MIDGLALLDGVDILSLPPDRAANVIFTILARNRDQDDYDRFVRDLELPPKGQVAEEGVWSKQSMGSDFLAAMEASKNPLANVPTPVDVSGDEG